MRADLPPDAWRALTAGRSRFLGVVLSVFLVGLLLLSVAAEHAVLWYQRSHWSDQAGRRAEAALQHATGEFLNVQRSGRRLAVEIAQHPAILGTLEGVNTDTAGLFAVLGRISGEKSVGVEVYDRSANLLAWEGRSGSESGGALRLALDGQLTSRVEEGPIFSFLYVVTPIRSAGAIIGAVLIRRIIAVHYPLSGRFVKEEDLGSTVSTELGLQVEYLYGPGAVPRKDGRFVSATLRGIDGAQVGVVNVMRPAQSSALENTAQRFRLLNALLIVTLLGVLVAVLMKRSAAIGSAFLRSLLVTGALWAVRYLLLWLEIPSGLMSGGIFDPSAFASKFGGGLARSVGELSITAATLAFTTVFTLRVVLERVRSGPAWWRPGSRFVRALLAVLAVFLVFLLLRGYGAAIRSAVFDSRLHYTDPGVILPSFPLAMMVANLFVLSFCLIVAAVGCVSFALSLLTRRTPHSTGVRTAWAVTLLLIVAAAVLFGVLQPNPLMSTPYRLVFGSVILVFTYHLHRTAERRHPLASLPGLLLVLAFSAAFMHPLLMEQVNEKDRGRLEALAGEMLQPVDRWLAFVVEDGLTRLVEAPSADVLARGSVADVDRLAFERWTGTVAGREGYSCRFAVTDGQGRLLSRFLLGDRRLFEENAPLPSRPDTTRSMVLVEVGRGLQAARLYLGSEPIRDDEGTLLGWAHVGIAAGQQALYRGENPALLRRLAEERGETFNRPLTLSEFRNGVLFTSTNPMIPLNYRVPESVGGRLRDARTSSVWFTETFGGIAYETLYAARGADGVVLALAMQELSRGEQVVNIVRAFVYYALMVVLLLAGWVLMLLARGRRYVFTFRDRLLGALLVTSLVPVIVLALYGRSLARERLRETTGRLLEQETAQVSAAILRRLPADPAAAEQESWSGAAELAAADLSTDFNLYQHALLTSTSRPELYDVGILDRRLSGEAFVNIAGKGMRFHQVTEQIGQYRYAVGYAPVLDQDNAILAVVSVPTLYRQEEIDRDVSQRNAVLFGLYGLLLVGTLVIATVLANRIAAPIHALTNATRRVARGDLDLDIPLPHAEGEIGELVHSFEAMTRDLKRNRDDLVKYERERAWKEMAQQVAHEIKNPLTPMKLSVQHLVQAFRDGAPNVREVVEDVSRTLVEQIDALSRIASEFSRFARMPKPRPEDCDVNAVLEDAVQLFEQEGVIDVERALASGLPVIRADREELRRAFINILRNGVQAMNGRGKVTVATERTTTGVRIAIGDEGTGISGEAMDRLFQPNFSTKTDGMGLGLAIVKKTVEDLHGTIRAVSAPGRGTTMIIEIPAAGGPANGTA